MSTLLNMAACSTQGNTGGTFCNLEPVRILYIFAVPKGTVIPAANMASQSAFATYVNARLHSDSRTTRWQVTPKLVEFKDNTKEPNTEDLDGFMNTTQWLPYDWQFEFANGFSGATFNVFQVWRNYINQQQNLYDFIFVDANNLWFGTSGLDGTGANGLASVALSNITVFDWKPATTKSTNKYGIRIIIQNNADLNQNWTSLQSTTQTSTFKALTDVSITAGTTAISATHIFVSGKIGGNTLGAQFGSTLAAATAWAVFNTTTSLAIVPSAVSYNATLDQYDLTVASVTTGNVVNVGIAVPSVITVTPFFANIVTEGTNVFTYTAP